MISGFGSVVLNYSIALTTKNLTQKDAEVVGKVFELIGARLEGEEGEMRDLYLTAVGNIVMRYPEVKGLVKGVKFGGGGQVEKDLEKLMK